MMRHVFQYHRMENKLGLFLGDPSLIPPLPPTDEETGNGGFVRPNRADEAGLTWTNDSYHPNIRDNRGAAHRQEEILQRQRQDLLPNNSNNTPNNSQHTIPYAVAAPATAPPAYKPDGSRI